MREPFDHYPRTPQPYPNNTGWRNKFAPVPGDWEHVCTSGECPAGNYFVTALDGPSFYYMAGPYPTHAEALALVDKAKAIAYEHDGKAWFMAWGTARSERTEPGSLNKHNLI
jgi:hypothetical protein